MKNPGYSPGLCVMMERKFLEIHTCIKKGQESVKNFV